MMVKDRATLILVFFVLLFSVYNAVTDRVELTEHHNFFGKMEKFANTGARFTAQDGKELCDEINSMKDDNFLHCEKFTKRKLDK